MRCLEVPNSFVPVTYLIGNGYFENLIPLYSLVITKTMIIESKMLWIYAEDGMWNQTILTLGANILSMKPNGENLPFLK